MVLTLRASIAALSMGITKGVGANAPFSNVAILKIALQESPNGAKYLSVGRSPT